MSERGLIVSIYKADGGDCSAGGVSSKADRAFLVLPSGPFEIPDGAEWDRSDERRPIPVLDLVRDDCCGRERVRAIPRDHGHGGAGPMFGGCFVYSSDGRFPSDTPIPLHDRWELRDQGGD